MLDAKMDLLATATSYAALSDVDVVIEAVFENMELKKKVKQEGWTGLLPKSAHSFL